MFYTIRTALLILLLGTTTVRLFQFTFLSTSSYKHNRCTKIKISVCGVYYCTLQQGKIFPAAIKPEISSPCSLESFIEAYI